MLVEEEENIFLVLVWVRKVDWLMFENWVAEARER